METSELQRLFFAVPIPDSITAQLYQDLEDFFGDEGMPGRPVKPGNWHLTLRFLGDTPTENIPRIKAAVQSTDLGTRFELRLGALGAFRSPTSATVLWVKLEDVDQQLATLAGQINSALEGAGIAPEKRPFVGHLTISRIRKPQNVQRFLDRFKCHAPPFNVDGAILYRSHLGDGPARYEVLQRYSLV